MKIYVASPFFCKFDKIVRKKAMDHFSGNELFLPDSTEASRSYDKSPGSDLAKVIFQENVDHIKSCDALLFWMPDNQDLGTMMEVGIAYKLGKRIFRYNYMTNTVTEILPKKEYFKFPEKFIVNVTSISDAFILGYNFENKNLYYSLDEGMKDNIMLSENFRRVVFKEGNYQIINVDYKEIQ